MVVKRKHDEVEKEEDVKDMKAPAAPSVSSSRQMQGQGDNKHSIDSDDEDDNRQESQLVPERLPLSHLLLSATMDATESASGRDCLLV